jgi:predicted metalloprotease with PDZ domain
MITYHVSYTRPHRHFITFDAVFPHDGKGALKLQLPSWRPGRYELGLFARNVRNWQAYAADGTSLPFCKFSRDGWEVMADGHKEVRITYEYYAAELNAGSTWLDSEQLYINPVNCFFYKPNDYSAGYRITLDLPEAYQVATGLRRRSRHEFEAAHFDELADCPLIASPSLKHLWYDCAGVRFHIWIQGEHRLDDDLLLKQFSAFTREQIAAFGSFPVPEYHFLFQFTPYFVRHGVEHTNSTVIAMGPVADFLNEAWYEKMLGISSHELYHTWNVKAIRPAEMQPYRFDRENYSRLGYVAEGVTTYFGDLMLRRSGVISEGSWFDILARHLEEHFDNPGRHVLSVADSSVDTWLDGYVAGVPGRKVSIYNEGSLIAWICDVRIRTCTGNRASLDTAMKSMYERFGRTGKGYSDHDYRQVLEETAGVSFADIFDRLVHGTSDYTPYLERTVRALGLEWKRERSPKWAEWALGLTVDESGPKMAVSGVVPDSPADLAGLWLEDEVVAVNGLAPYRNIHHLLRMHSGRDMRLTVLRKHRQIEVHLRDDGHVWKWKHSLCRQSGLDESTANLFASWAGDDSAGKP